MQQVNENIYVVQKA